MPVASFARTFAVAGATMARSHACARSTWRTRPDSSQSEAWTGPPVRPAKVAAPTKRSADLVRTVVTRAPAPASDRARTHAL